KCEALHVIYSCQLPQTNPKCKHRSHFERNFDRPVHVAATINGLSLRWLAGRGFAESTRRTNHEDPGEESSDCRICIGINSLRVQPTCRRLLGTPPDGSHWLCTRGGDGIRPSRRGGAGGCCLAGSRCVAGRDDRICTSLRDDVFFAPQCAGDFGRCGGETG